MVGIVLSSFLIAARRRFRLPEHPPCQGKRRARGPSTNQIPQRARPADSHRLVGNQADAAEEVLDRLLRGQRTARPPTPRPAMSPVTLKPEFWSAASGTIATARACRCASSWRSTRTETTSRTRSRSQVTITIAGASTGADEHAMHGERERKERHAARKRAIALRGVPAP
jgi:hypothetical protein